VLDLRVLQEQVHHHLLEQAKQVLDILVKLIEHPVFELPKQQPSQSTLKDLHLVQVLVLEQEQLQEQVLQLEFLHLPKVS
jgi:hypothetical protein